MALIERSPVGAGVPADVRSAARRNGLALHTACGGGAGAVTLATVSCASELLAAVAVDLAAEPAEAHRLIGELQVAAAVPRVALGQELLRSGAGRAMEVGATAAIEVQLSLLLVFTDALAVSLWRLGGDDATPTLEAAVGELDSAPPPEAVVTALADERRGLVAGERTLALRVGAAGRAVTAATVHGIDPAPPAHGLLLTAGAPALAEMSDRMTLIGGLESQESITAAAERRLARLRFDLHDGPQQDVHLLAQDLRLFRDQLRPMIAGDPNRDRALGRLDDLEAQLMALDGGLRRLSTAARSPFLDPGSLQGALTELARAFAERTGVEPDTRFGGDLRHLSDSQQITLLALIREALSNIRKHGDAERVWVAIDAGPAGVTVSITDDGSGFDPETTVALAARAGSLGLVGMRERVRMLGGRTQIDSRPGGPTVISATLPPWPGEEP
jgi:signal transduction histidine kinase